MKDFAVVFLSNNARIVKDPTLIEALRKWPNAVINPKLGSVKGTPPQFWKLVEGHIVPMTPEERAEREKVLDKVDTVVRRIPAEEPAPAPIPEPATLPVPKKPRWILWAALGVVAVGAALSYVLA